MLRTSSFIIKITRELEYSHHYNQMHDNYQGNGHIFLKNHYSSASSLSLTMCDWMGPSSSSGANFTPSALKNLLSNSTHCRRSACKKHSIVSINMMTPKEMFRKK